MGVKIQQFDVPVCNSFKAKVLNDQLCYEVDLNDFKEMFSFTTLSKGLTFYVDTNEDRATFEDENDFKIYIHSLGRFLI